MAARDDYPYLAKLERFLDGVAAGREYADALDEIDRLRSENAVMRQRAHPRRIGER